MAKPEHLNVLKQGVDVWNEWRWTHPDVDLSGADLSDQRLGGAHLHGADLTGANLEHTTLVDATFYAAVLKNASLSRANLIRASMRGADVSGASLNEAVMEYADLTEAILVGSSLTRAHLNKAILTRANLERATLRGAYLTGAQLIETNLREAVLDDCFVYGTAVWDAILDGASEANLVISAADDVSVIRADGLEVAQFLYMLLNHRRLRDIISRITLKVVLILGRFTPERKAVLDALREALRKREYVPVQFDFEKPASRDLTETIRILAGLSRFVIADLTDPRSVPHELMSAVEHSPSVPVQPIILKGQEPYGMFEHFRRYPWVLPEYVYEDLPSLLAALPDKVIGPVEAKASEQTGS